MPVSLDVLALTVAVVSLVVAIAALRKVAGQKGGSSTSAGPEPVGSVSRGDEADAPRKAHVHVAVVGVGRNHRVVVSNVGPGVARHVTLSLEPRGEARLSPLVQADCDEKLPIPELPPGGVVSLLATVSSGTGSEFALRALWINEDGSREVSAGVITAP